MLERQVRPERHRGSVGPRGSTIVALGLALAGVLHLAAAVRHLELNALTATGLAAAGLLQLAGARAVRLGRPPATNRVMGLTASLVVLAVASHTVGAGPLFGEGHPHRLGPLGWATVAVQALTVATWVCSAGGTNARRQLPSVAIAALLLGGLTAAALPPQLQHGDHHHGAGPDHDHGDDHHGAGPDHDHGDDHLDHEAAAVDTTAPGVACISG